MNELSKLSFYRALVVILRLKWNSSVNIWNLGVLVSDISTPIILCALNYSSLGSDLIQSWGLLFAEHLFGSDNEEDNLASMVTYLGQPPSGNIGVK